MKNYPLISITIPCYNHEHFVKKTLDSVINDPYPNKEIIIIDDCSIDNSWKVIQKWVEIHQVKIKIKIYFERNKINLGVSKTVNKLHSLCNGEYVVGIASDDQLISGGIEKRIKYLESNLHKKVVFGDCIVIDENDNTLYNSGLSDLYNLNKLNLLNDNDMRRELILNWGVPGGTLMMRKDLIKEIKFNEELIVEDLDLFLKWMSKNYLGFIDEKISRYRLHSSNASRNQSFKIRRYKDTVKTIFSNMKYFNFYYKLILMYSLWKKIINQLKG